MGLHTRGIQRTLFRSVRFLLLALSLLLAGLLSGFVAMRYAIRGTVVVIPNLVGQTVDSAAEALHGISLKMTVLARKPDSRMPANTIMAQDPIAGTPAKPDQAVRVIVSSGEKREAIPNVVGSSLRLAQLSLVRLGHRLGDVCRVHYGTEGVSQIVYQNPPAGESSESGVAVDVVLNLGVPEVSYVMPDLIGRGLNETIRLFDRYTMKIESVSYESSSNGVRGTILAQQPESGYRLTREMPIRLFVGR